MVTRKTRQGAFDNDAAKAVGDSAQKIWLAGLGAFERARAEGPRMFDVLVEQGRGIAERAQGAAGDALRGVREGAVDASARLEKLEQAVQERLARSAERLGVLTRGEVDDLSNQVRELADSVRQMMAANAARDSRDTAAPRRGAKTRTGAAKRSVKRAAGTAKRKATGAGKAVRKTTRKAVRKATRKPRAKGR